MIPTSKTDTDAIIKLQRATDIEVLKNSEELLFWLQDINWPVFEGVCNRLALLGSELYKDIGKILLGKDTILKANIIGRLIPKFSIEAQSLYIKELEKLLVNPSNSDFEEGLIDFIEIQLSQNDKSI